MRQLMVVLAALLLGPRVRQVASALLVILVCQATVAQEAATEASRCVA